MNTATATAAAAVPASRFVRRTTLNESEYHRNFRKLDSETISLLTSSEASKITSQMCKVYLSLVNVPPEYLEREGVLRFAGCEKEGEWQTAWEQLVSLLGVASATARKALLWMSKKGIIGYYAGRNGVGIRVFLNRAASSIGHRDGPAQKNLRLVQASSGAPHTSPTDTPFKDSFADLEISDTDIDPDAPENGANTKAVDKFTSTTLAPNTQTGIQSAVELHEVAVESVGARHIALGEIIARIRCEIEPSLKSAAAQAAAQATRCEIERTRTWFETKALPKAVRVAQSECYNLLKKYGSLDEKPQRLRAGLEVGRHMPSEAVETTRARTPQEVNEMAEACLALLETQGQSIEVTLSEISAEGGGWLLLEDAPRVRAAAELLLTEREGRD